MTIHPLTLEALVFHWGDVYVICYQRDRWVAKRRASELLFDANTLAELETEIEADFQTR